MARRSFISPPFAFTEAAPSDGLIVADTAKIDDGLIASVERAVNGARGPTLLLELFEADRLERSAPSAYAHLRAALASTAPAVHAQPTSA